MRTLGFVWLVTLGSCGSTPDRTSERSSKSVTAPSSASAAPTAAPSARPSAEPSAAAPASGSCDELRKTIVAEAAKLSTCEADADCKIHPLRLCGWPELDCHATHVNKAGSTADLDAAVAEFAKTCPISKCKCARPEKSVCKNGKCTGG